MLVEFGLARSRGASVKAFEKACYNFIEFECESPSDYVNLIWKSHKEINGLDNANINGAVFEYIFATLLVRENILPIFLQAEVAFVPNVVFDCLIWTEEYGPVCLTSKTSLRERYKQADLESMALKNVHRNARSYLLTLDERACNAVKNKIEKGDVLGLDDAVIATSERFDELIEQLRGYSVIEPGTIDVIPKAVAITPESVRDVTSNP